MIFFEYAISRKGNINFSRMFHDSLMSMIPTFWQNFSSKCLDSFSHKFLVPGQKFRGMIIASKERCKSTISFTNFVISLGLAYEQNMSPNGGNHLGMFPPYKSIESLALHALSVAKRKFRYRKKIETFPVP